MTVARKVVEAVSSDERRFLFCDGITTTNVAVTAKRLWEGEKKERKSSDRRGD